MFGLIRRISHSVLPRADRPWDDDATSNAPKSHSRKRRLSSTEREDGPKKVRGDTPLDGPSTPDVNVKEVTKGVKDVDLNAETMVEEAAAVPLPDAPDGELDGADSIASTPEHTPDVEVAVDAAAALSSDVPLFAAAAAAAAEVAVPEDTGAAGVDDSIPDNAIPATHDSASTLDAASHEESSPESVSEEKAEIVHVEDVDTPSEEKDAEEDKGKAKAD